MLERPPEEERRFFPGLDAPPPLRERGMWHVRAFVLACLYSLVTYRIDTRLMNVRAGPKG